MLEEGTRLTTIYNDLLDGYTCITAGLYRELLLVLYRRNHAKTSKGMQTYFLNTYHDTINTEELNAILNLLNESFTEISLELLKPISFFLYTTRNFVKRILRIFQLN
jgi:hypothetical protein